MSETIQVLRKVAADIDEFALKELENPDWEKSRRFRWAWYVDDVVAQLWDNLPEEAKLVAFIHAARDCDRDDLDF